MSNEIITWLKAELAKFEGEEKPVVTVVEADAEAIGKAAIDYIKNKSLTALYNIATSALLGAASDTPWVTILAAVVSAGESAGIAILKGAEGVVVAQAQADLIAAGKLLSPSVITAPTA